MTGSEVYLVFGKGLNGSDSGGSDIPDILTFTSNDFFIITPALLGTC